MKASESKKYGSMSISATVAVASCSDDVSMVGERQAIGLRDWRVYEVRRACANGLSLHLVGRQVASESGRVSSPIVAIDVASRKGTSQTGRTYELLGEPGWSSDAHAVWEANCRTYGASDVRDITDAVAQSLKSDGHLIRGGQYASALKESRFHERHVQSQVARSIRMANQTCEWKMHCMHHPRSALQSGIISSGHYLSPRRKAPLEPGPLKMSSGESSVKASRAYIVSISCKYSCRRLRWICAEKDVPSTLAMLLRYMGASGHDFGVHVEVALPSDVWLILRKRSPLASSGG